jgi:hypothetical protein
MRSPARDRGHSRSCRCRLQSFSISVDRVRSLSITVCIRVVLHIPDVLQVFAVCAARMSASYPMCSPCSQLRRPWIGSVPHPRDAACCYGCHKDNGEHSPSCLRCIPLFSFCPDRVLCINQDLRAVMFCLHRDGERSTSLSPCMLVVVSSWDV